MVICTEVVSSLNTGNVNKYTSVWTKFSSFIKHTGMLYWSFNFQGWANPSLDKQKNYMNVHVHWIIFIPANTIQHSNYWIHKNVKYKLLLPCLCINSRVAHLVLSVCTCMCIHTYMYMYVTKIPALYPTCYQSQSVAFFEGLHVIKNVNVRTCTMYLVNRGLNTRSMSSY